MSGLGISGEEAALNMAAALGGGCEHANIEPVETIVGEHVAGLCVDCDRQLPAGWSNPFLPPKRVELRR